MGQQNADKGNSKAATHLDLSVNLMPPLVLTYRLKIRTHYSQQNIKQPHVTVATFTPTQLSLIPVPVVSHSHPG